MAYEISKQAEADLENIFDFTMMSFGIHQAEHYLLQFDSTFILLSNNPKLGRTRNEIRKGLRSYVLDKYVIFYGLFKTNVRIVRVIHGSRDLPKYVR